MSSNKVLNIFSDRELGLLHSSVVSVFLIAQQDSNEVPEGFLEACNSVIEKLDTAMELRLDEVKIFAQIVESSLQDVYELTPTIVKEETEQ